MTLKIKTGYRLNVAMIVLNKDNKVLFCKRRNTENWQFWLGVILVLIVLYFPKGVSGLFIKD